MANKSLLERLKVKKPPSIWIFWKQKATYGRRCRIRTPCKKKGLGWIPRIFLPWREATDYLEINLELQMEISGKHVPQFVSRAQIMNYIPVSLHIPDDDDIGYKKWLSENYGYDFDEEDEEDEDYVSCRVAYFDNEISLTKGQIRKLNAQRKLLGYEAGDRAFKQWLAHGEDAEHEDLIAYFDDWNSETYEGLSEIDIDYDIGGELHNLKKTMKLLDEDYSFDAELGGECVDSYVKVKDKDDVLRLEKLKFFSKKIAGGFGLQMGIYFERFGLYAVDCPLDYQISIEGRKNLLSEKEFLDEIL
jgi:hypothetical protein